MNHDSYYVSMGVVTPVEALREPPESPTHYVVVRSKGQIIAAEMAARLHGIPYPLVISSRSSTDNDVLAVLSDRRPRTTACIHQELHLAYKQLSFPWRLLWRVSPFKWQVEDALEKLWTQGKIARYSSNGWKGK